MWVVFILTIWPYWSYLVKNLTTNWCWNMYIFQHIYDICIYMIYIWYMHIWYIYIYICIRQLTPANGAYGLFSKAGVRANNFMFCEQSIYMIYVDKHESRLLMYYMSVFRYPQTRMWWLNIFECWLFMHEMPLRCVSFRS